MMMELNNVYIIENFRLHWKHILFGQGNHKNFKDLFEIWHIFCGIIL